ncbi:FRG domain-containing protein [Pandoraea pnomenusa]|uniref:FRG domain-containing protein n=1 Tax=Pandoraea pnomenusa TaxID=93220 RepID=UPI00043759D1|nr:FRG domain-containing protein [Pandoraea pnomenusa]
MPISAEQLTDATGTISIPVDSWRHFEDELRNLSDAYGRLEKNVSGGHLPHLLYRGQSHASYRLTTTLERYPVRIDKFSDYYEAIFGARHEIESSSGTQWEIPTTPEVEEALSSTLPMAPPAYEYMLYLRHHGFPSPILDWSRSPYIAAFFAFQKYDQSQHEPVSVYAYLERTGLGKGGASSEPTIVGLGPLVRTHRRHYLQQAEYTICIKRTGNDWLFEPHESAIGKAAGQDVLIKFDIPASERKTALEMLDKFNLNAWSLMGSEEGLMETMAMRQFDFSERVRRRQLRIAHERERASSGLNGETINGGPL